jgi:hypothetical protein
MTYIDMAQRPDHLILADGHVHIYGCFDLDCLLTSAFENFAAEARRRSLSSDFTGVLLLTETVRENCFQRLAEQARSGQKAGTEGWSFHLTRESASLVAQRGAGKSVILIAGRQIVTSENLEVLALATPTMFDDGTPLRRAIELIRAQGGIPVVPWGFGKWWGKRGKHLADLISDGAGQGIFLGDSGGRPAFLPRPYQFQLGEEIMMRILPGTDPLPFAQEAVRPGRFGFAIHRALDHQRPAHSLKQIILDPSICLSPYGSLESPYRFFRNQLGLRLSKWRGAPTQS